MRVELDKEDLISLVKGTVPNYDIWSDNLISRNGQYYGGFSDEWKWKYGAFKDCTEQQIYDTYLLIKNSWKKK